MIKYLKENTFRCFAFAALSLALLVFINHFYQAQIGIIALKTVYVTLAAFLAYHIDRSFFPHNRIKEGAEPLIMFRRVAVFAVVICGFNAL